MLCLCRPKSLKEVGDREGLEALDEEEEQPEDIDDEHEEPTPAPKKRRAAKARAKQAPAAKRSKAAPEAGQLAESSDLLGTLALESTRWQRAVRLTAPFLAEALTKGKSAGPAVQAWVQRFEQDKESGAHELLLFFFQACGCSQPSEIIPKGEIEEGDIDDVVNLVVEHMRKEGGNGHLLDPKKPKSQSGFRHNFEAFWRLLVKECEGDLLYEEDNSGGHYSVELSQLFDKLFNYVIAIGGKAPRSARFAGTITGLELVCGLLDAVAPQVDARSTAERQLAALDKGAKSKSSTKAMRTQLEKTQDVAHKKIQALQEGMNKLFKGVFTHRYRDVDASLRAYCMRLLARWIYSYPDYFLKDTYLKYLGWMINDKDDGVRLAAVSSLSTMYTKLSDYRSSVEAFTLRFEARFLQLCMDVSGPVASEAIALLGVLVDNELVALKSVQPLYTLLIDDTASIRQAMAKLVYALSVRADKPGSGSAKKKAKKPDHKELEQLLKVLGDLYELSEDPADVVNCVVDAMWDITSCLSSWETLTELVLDDNSKYDDTQISILLHVISAAAQKAAGKRIVASDGKKHETVSKKVREKNREVQHKLTEHMITELPKLIRRYQADEEKLAALLAVVPCMQVEQFVLSSQEKAYGALMKIIKDAFFKNSETAPLRGCASALLTAQEQECDQLDKLSANTVSQCCNALSKQIVKLIDLMSDRKACEDQENALALLVTLKRTYELHVKCDVSLDDALAKMTSMLQDVQNNDLDVDEDILVLLIENLHLSLVWKLRNALESDAGDGDAELRDMHEAFMKKLEYFIQRPSQLRAASSAFRCMADIFVLFSAQSPALRRLDCVEPSSELIQKFWECAKCQLQAIEDREEEEEEDRNEEGDARDVMKNVCKLLYFGVVDVELLGPQVVSHWMSYGPEVAEVVKLTYSRLKQTGNVPQGQLLLDSLIAAYEREDVDNLEREDTLLQQTSCRRLANKLASLFAGFSYTAEDKREVFKLVEHGLKYVLDRPEKRCYFFECALAAFTGKLAPLDAGRILSMLRDAEGDITPQYAAEVVAEYAEQIEERSKAKVDKILEKQLNDAARKPSRKTEGADGDAEEEQRDEDELEAEKADEQEEEEPEEDDLDEDVEDEEDGDEGLEEEEDVGATEEQGKALRKRGVAKKHGNKVTLLPDL
eukprot:scaffold1786_cov398-Prasinococcus_capsulatus_cf.AAC.39